MKKVLLAMVAASLSATTTLACMGGHLLQISDNADRAMVVYNKITGRMESRSRSHSVTSIVTEAGENVCVDANCTVLKDIKVATDLEVSYMVFGSQKIQTKIIRQIQIGQDAPRTRGAMPKAMGEKSGLSISEFENLSENVNAVGCAQKQ